MGVLVDGQWRDQSHFPTEDGRFQRQPSQFRNWITPHGAAGPSGEGGFAAEAGRYHLYVSYACPWAHRTLIFRRLKGLEGLIDVSVVHPHMLASGWEFEAPEPLYGYQFLHELYCRADAHYTGRVLVPTLWDKDRETIVSNESAEIIRMFNSAFDALTGNEDDYYPAELRGEIDAINAEIYEYVNNGVYRCGFASSQTAYEEAYDALFAMLDSLEARLGRQRYLVGDQITEADWRLFTTLIRFDAVYYGHFKCNKRRIVDCPNLWGYLRELYQHPGIADTVQFDHIKQHYYYSHASINPTRIVPKGPELALDSPHGRGSN